MKKERFNAFPFLFWLGLSLSISLPSWGQSSANFYAYEQDDGVVQYCDYPPQVKTYRVIRYNIHGAVRKALKVLSRSEIKHLITEIALETGADPALIEAVVKAESAYDPKAVSRKGARGLMQLMPATAASLGVRDPHDPKQNLRGGIQYFQRMLQKYHGNIDLAAAAYNAGPGAVERHGGIPPYAETIDYVRKVRKYYEDLSHAEEIAAIYTVR